MAHSFTASPLYLTPRSSSPSTYAQGLLNKKPADRLGWPQLLDHPFVRETQEERLKREKALADALEVADSSRAWRVGQSGWGLAGSEGWVVRAGQGKGCRAVRAGQGGCGGMAGPGGVGWSAQGRARCVWGGWQSLEDASIRARVWGQGPKPGHSRPGLTRQTG